MSYAEAHEEVVADAMATMLSDGSFYDLIMEIKVKDKGLFATIKRFFKDMIAKFTKEYANLTPDQQDAQDIRQMKDMFDKIQKAFAEALVGASDNFQATQEQLSTDSLRGDIENGALLSERFVEDKYFARQIDRFRDLKEGSYVTVGKIITGSPIERVGIPAGNLYFDVSKIRQEMVDRKDPIPPETIKSIPKVLDNPMLITEFVDKAGRHSINVYGKLYIGSSPVVIGIMIGKHRNGQAVDKIQTVHPNRKFLDEVTDSNTLYLGENKKETNAWFQALGAQEPPLGGTKYGFIRMVSQLDAEVKSKSAEAMDVEMDAKTESVAPAVMKSERTWTESDYVQERNKAAKEIAKAIGVTEKKAKDYIDSVNSIAKMIAEDRSRLDYFSSPGRSSFIGNGNR